MAANFIDVRRKPGDHVSHAAQAADVRQAADALQVTDALAGVWERDVFRHQPFEEIAAALKPKLDFRWPETACSGERGATGLHLMSERSFDRSPGMNADRDDS